MLRKKKKDRQCLSFFLRCGAEGGTRTRTDLSTRPSNVRGYQLRHLGLENKILKDQKLLLLLFLLHFCLAELPAASEFAEEVLVGPFTGAVFTAGTFAGVSTAGWAAGVASGAGVSVAAGSGFELRTDLSPVSAGIASMRAESMNTVADTIVIFESTVCVPRGANALLDMLLVKSAPASVLPGCRSTEPTSARHETKKIA